MPGPIIFYHGDCLDGFGAAYAAWRRFGGNAAYRPMFHGQAWQGEELTGREVFIFDFSFPVADLLAMAGQARSVYLLDHHVSARDAWARQLPAGGEAGLALYRHPALPLTVAFDLDKSGARLAWECLHPGEPLPLALAHIEDQDLWRYRLPETRPFCRALRLAPFDFADWDGIVRQTGSPGSETYRHMLAEGAAIERFCALEVERLGNSSLVQPVVLKGDPVDPLQATRHDLPVITDEAGSRHAIAGLGINANALFASDLGNYLARRSGTFALIWQQGGDGIVRASLRACGRVNVAALAQNYGGGGHPNAAGFRLPGPRFFAEILKIPTSPSDD